MFPCHMNQLWSLDLFFLLFICLIKVSLIYHLMKVSHEQGIGTRFIRWVIRFRPWEIKFQVHCLLVVRYSNSLGLNLSTFCIVKFSCGSVYYKKLYVFSNAHHHSLFTSLKSKQQKQAPYLGCSESSELLKV